MELLTSIAAIAISLVSPTGLLVNHFLSNAISSSLEKAERLEVRVEPIPSHEILQGRANGLKVAARGLETIEQLRIAVLELETDEIDLDFSHLKQSNLEDFKRALRKPLQGGIRLVLTEKDLNQALQSEKLMGYIEKYLANSEGRNWQIVNPRLNLIAGNRVALEAEVKLANTEEETLNVTLDLGLEAIGGHQLRIVDPRGTLNGRKLSRKLLQGFADNISMQLDFRNLEPSGVTLRVLQLNIDDGQMHLAAFVRIVNQDIEN